MFGLDTGFIVTGIFALLIIFVLAKTAVIVPQQQAFVVEKLGKYSRTLNAGFSILVPFLERVAYRHSLKEHAMDIPEQVCITRDNVQVGVDGVLYLQVTNPERASYGSGDFVFAITQLAQTTLRSEVGKIDLDKTFEERSAINLAVVDELDKASDPWGVKVLRYEIKNINPPQDVLSAMEKQMRAEREKRATVLTSEGDRDAKINEAEGEKRRVVLESEAAQAQQVNEARGEAEAILEVAKATAAGIELVGRSVMMEGGDKALQLRIAEDYLSKFGNLAKEGTTLIVPATLADMTSMIGAATTIFDHTKREESGVPSGNQAS